MIDTIDEALQQRFELKLKQRQRAKESL